MAGKVVEIPGAGCECRTIPGYDGYAVSKNGDVYSMKTPAMKKLQHRKGAASQQVSLVDGERICSVQVARCVLLAFVGEPKREQIAVHIDGDKNHNWLDNLKWGTRQEAKARQWVNNPDKRIGKAKLSDAEVRDIRERYATDESTHDIAKDYGLTRQFVCEIATGIRYKHSTSEPVHRGKGGHPTLRAFQVVELRKRYASGEDAKELAQEYGLSLPSVYKIARGHSCEGYGGPLTDRHCSYHGAVLNTGKVKTIKRQLKSGEPVRVIAKKYGVSKCAIYDIKNGKTWANVTES